MRAFKKNPKPKIDFLVFFILSLFSPLFFYNLGAFSLVDFDEAWYGEIAKNILKTHQLFVPMFNGKPFYDHPPFGFDLMAISIWLFGPNEFAVRLPSAICGFLSLFVVYLIGKKLFNRAVGLGAAFILVSCVWFLLRARTGDLDTILLFFFLLSFYLAIKMKENINFIFLLPFSIAALLLTKSIIGLAIIPPILTYLLLNRVKLPVKKVIQSAILFLVILSPWIIQNYLQNRWEFIQKMIEVGTRTGKNQKINFIELHKSVTLVYLHFGIRKWFYPIILATLSSIAFLKKEKNLIPLYVWIVILLYGFLTNQKTEIWHLIPLYPPLALILSFFIYKVWEFWKVSKPFAGTLTVITILAAALFQINNFKGEIKLFDHDKSGLSQSAKAAKNLPEPLYLDTDVSIPAVAAFYSDKYVNVIPYQKAPANNLKGTFQYQQRPFLLIVEKWKLDLDKIDPKDYQIISQNDSFVLVKVN